MEDKKAEDYDGILKDGIYKGHKDHTENSPYAEDCFCFDLMEEFSFNYDSQRYCAFEKIFSNESYEYAKRIMVLFQDELKKIQTQIKSLKTKDKNKQNELAEQLNICKKYIGLCQMQINDCEKFKTQSKADSQFLNQKYYQEKIDKWIENVKKTNAKAIKIVLDVHGSKRHTFGCTKEFYSSGEVDFSECLQYLLNRIKEETINGKIKKNVEIVNKSCYHAINFGENKSNLIDIVKDFAKNVNNKNNSVKVIYSCSFDDNAYIEQDHLSFNNTLLKYANCDKDGNFTIIGDKDMYKQLGEDLKKYREKLEEEEAQQELCIKQKFLEILLKNLNDKSSEINTAYSDKNSTSLRKWGLIKKVAEKANNAVLKHNKTEIERLSNKLLRSITCDDEYILLFLKQAKEEVIGKTKNIRSLQKTKNEHPECLNKYLNKLKSIKEEKNKLLFGMRKSKQQTEEKNKNESNNINVNKNEIKQNQLLGENKINSENITDDSDCANNEIKNVKNLDKKKLLPYFQPKSLHYKKLGLNSRKKLIDINKYKIRNDNDIKK